MADEGCADSTETSDPPRRDVARLLTLFGCFYVFQALCESGGLLSLPITTLLKSWKWQDHEVANFYALLGIPWIVKPLYGLLTDCVPIAGYHRKVYLIAAGAVATLAFAIATCIPLDSGGARLLFALLFVSALAIAFSDVVIDALMVETGKPRGLTGRFQSVQWTAIYAASIAGAMLGGRLSERHLERETLAIAAGLALVSTLLAIVFVREKRRPPAPRGEAAAMLRSQARAALRQPGLLAVAGFLLLWNFNPFSAKVLQLHMLGPLELSKTFCGDCDALGWAAAMLGSVAYGFYCRRVSLPWLVHGAILLGVASTLTYLPLCGPRTALAASAISGLANATAVLMLLDLAARLCPSDAAGTVFALLMSATNLGMDASQSLGGYWLDAWMNRLGSDGAFKALVLVGAFFTAACWLLAPLLIRALAGAPADRAGTAKTD